MLTDDMPHILLNTRTQKGQKYHTHSRNDMSQSMTIIYNEIKTCLKRVKSSALLNSKGKKIYT